MFDIELSDWDALMKEAVAMRHHLHKNPELTWQEEQTAQTVRSILDKAGIKWRACATHGTVATIAADKKDAPHIGLRGDMDALPIDEQSGVDWTSENQGCMHACGHDGHTATLMAAALWLKQQEDSLLGPVSFVFQPAEEGGHGAREMIKDGALDGIDMLYGWHNWPAIPFGKAACQTGPIMSANGTFEITIKGVGGHSSQPELCRDPVLAGSAIVMNLQQIVARKIAPQMPAVVSVTSFDAPSGLTVIPDSAILSGSIRVSDTKMRDTINDMIKEIAEDTAKSYGVQALVETTPRYGATVNHPDQANAYAHALEEELGLDWNTHDVAIPIMASEDFSYFLENIPGAFALIGANDGKNTHKVSCHNPGYDFNDDLIPLVTRVYTRLVGGKLP